jgi:hypothetical protein
MRFNQFLPKKCVIFAIAVRVVLPIGIIIKIPPSMPTKAGDIDADRPSGQEGL